MVLSSFIHIIYAILVWGFLLIFIKPQRIKELWPAALLAVVLLFATEYFLISLKLYKFNNPGISLGGIPLFHLLWGAGGGIVFTHYIKKAFTDKILMILLFTAIVVSLEAVVELVGAASHLGRFTQVHEAFLDIILLSAFVWVIDNLWRMDIVQDLYPK